MTELGIARYDAMCTAIADCYRVDEAKGIRDKAKALEVYARQAKNRDAERKACEIRIRAERRTGELLEDSAKSGQRATAKGNLKEGPKYRNNTSGDSCIVPATLEELGISRVQSSKWQKLARVPQDDFEEALSNPATHPSTEGIISGACVHYSSESAEWYTPKEIVKMTVDVLGSIDLDPCADPQKSIPASQHLTAQEDGLTYQWNGRVYMNPPYGREIEPWIEKLCSEYGRGNVTEAIALVPARVDTDWFRRFRDFAVCFIDGRLKFSGHSNSAPFPSAVIYLGRDIGKFDAVFGAIGDAWVRWRKV